MRPLVCTDKNDAGVRRRSRRRKGPSNRSERVELRVEPLELASWVAAASGEHFSLSDWMRDKCNGAARLAPLLSSEREDWNTPPELLARFAALGPIDLDPCTNATSIVPARRVYTEDDDGLARSWLPLAFGPRAFVWCNPPYSASLPDWVLKACAEYERGAEVLMLVPARTDTHWFASLNLLGSIALLRGRVRFLGAPSGAPFPSAVGYLGDRHEAFRRVAATMRAAVLPPVISPVDQARQNRARIARTLAKLSRRAVQNGTSASACSSS